MPFALTVRSGKVHSAFDDMAETVSLNVPFADRTLSTQDRLNLEIHTPYPTRTKFTRSSPETRNFYRPALAFAEKFNAGHAPLLFKTTDSAHPLAFVSNMLGEFGSGESVVESMVNTQQDFLQECHDASQEKNLPRLKKALEDVVDEQAWLHRNTDEAIAALAELDSADLSNTELTAQAKAEAKIVIAALNQFRECLTGENSAEGNVYADFVAFAKQATTFEPSLEAAQAMFSGIGSKARTVPTPTAALERPPETAVKLPDPPPPQLTPDQKFAKQNLSVVAKNVVKDDQLRLVLQVESPPAQLALALNGMDAMTNAEGPRTRNAGKLKYKSAMAQLGPWGVDAAYMLKASANIAAFKELAKKSWLLTNGPVPLRPVAKAVTDSGAIAALFQFASRREMLLNAAYAEMAKEVVDLKVLGGVIKERVDTENDFFKRLEGLREKLLDVKDATPETLAVWKKAGVKDKEAGEIRQDAKALVEAYEDLERLARHPVFQDFRETFYDAKDESLFTAHSLTALADRFKSLPKPVPPGPEQISAQVAAAFGKSTKPHVDLVNAMERLKAVQATPPTRPLFGSALDKTSVRLDMISSPQQLTDRFDRVFASARAVRVAADQLNASSPEAAALQGQHARAKMDFNKTLKDMKTYVNSQLDNIYESLNILEGVAKSSAGKAAKADAEEMRQALQSLKEQWENDEGPAQQIVKFAEIGALYPESALEALNLDAVSIKA